MKRSLMLLVLVMVAPILAIELQLRSCTVAMGLRVIIKSRAMECFATLLF